MNRREFLSALGIGTAALALDPYLIAAPSRACEIYPGYPVPFFTGFKHTQASTDLSGQFLWRVLFEDAEYKARHVTFWYVNSSFHLDDIETRDTGVIQRKTITVADYETLPPEAYLNGSPQRDAIVIGHHEETVEWKERIVTDKGKAFIRSRLQNSFLTYVSMVDGIVEKAERGLVETTDNPTVTVSDNPDYDPWHAKEHEDASDIYGCIYCMKQTTSLQNRDIPVQRLRILPFHIGDDFDSPVAQIDPLNPERMINEIVDVAVSRIRV